MGKLRPTETVWPPKVTELVSRSIFFTPSLLQPASAESQYHHESESLTKVVDGDHFFNNLKWKVPGTPSSKTHYSQRWMDTSFPTLKGNKMERSTLWRPTRDPVYTSAKSHPPKNRWFLNFCEWTTNHLEFWTSYLKMPTKKTILSIRRGKNIVHITHIEKNENQTKCPLTKE